MNKENKNSELPAGTSSAGPVLDVAAIQEKLARAPRKQLWRNLEEVAETAEFKALLENEFAQSPTEAALVPADTISRRHALWLMAASAALTGLTGCTALPDERIVPYVKAPEEVVPGRPLFYATSMPHNGLGMGLLVESHTGRPTKVEGNPKHPASLGATDVFAQASVLTLYDPDRSQAILHEGRIEIWPTFVSEMKALRATLAQDRGKGLRVLTESSSSPTLLRQMQMLLQQFPEAKWYVHEPCGRFNSYAGTQLCFGREANPVYRVDRASVILSLDADFLDRGPACVRYAHDFAGRRDVERSKQEMNRLYVVESTPTNTGALADHRFPMRCGEISSLARVLAAGVGLNVPGAAAPGWLSTVIEDLKKNRGKSLVLAGESQPAYVHALVCAINEALGNTGQTVLYTQPPEVSPLADSLQELAREMENGEVSTLLVISANPVYTAPVDLKFSEKLAKVRLRIHLGLFGDETAELCHWHVPEAHYLESWGDARAYDGTAGIIQPLIYPLYQGVSGLEVLNLLATGAEGRSYDLVRQHWNGQRTGGDFESFWRKTLHDGMVEDSAFGPRSSKSQLDLGKLPSAENGAASGAIEVVFRPDPTIGDGRWANNSWLQELPKPLTKLTWDNALMLSPMTAWKLGLSSGDVARIRNGPWEVVGPVWAMPGHADNSATMPLGYGRRRAGHVGNEIGLNGYLIRTSDKPDIAGGLQITKTGRTHLMATTQMHHPIDINGQQLEEESVSAFHRDVVRIGTLDDFRKHPDFAADKEDVRGRSLFPPYQYEGYAWGMSIDLNRCTGCSACVIACYAENNIAVVGKYEVMAGRDMQWIRVDNYYRGDLRNPEMYFQPVPCMHCEQAPCELVCPVGATLHSSEGLNEMIYNRCVGTRYCSNNCPYKVRRFNFKLYSDWDTRSLYPLRNPDVTVRSRGVMEKCSYCVQRINAAKITSEEEGRHVRDGEIRTACQQVCPAEAIVFGNINDSESQVAQRKASPRKYSLLGELNTRPRTTYLAKLTNPNPDISHG